MTSVLVFLHWHTAKPKFDLGLKIPQAQCVWGFWFFVTLVLELGFLPTSAKNSPKSRGIFADIGKKTSLKILAGRIPDSICCGIWTIISLSPKLAMVKFPFMAEIFPPVIYR
jgi:hypothetical protein